MGAHHTREGGSRCPLLVREGRRKQLHHASVKQFDSQPEGGLNIQPNARDWTPDEHSNAFRWGIEGEGESTSQLQNPVVAKSPQSSYRAIIWPPKKTDTLNYQRYSYM